MASVNLVNIFTCLRLRICETGTWCVTNWIIIIIFKNYFQIFYPERISQDLKKNYKESIYTNVCTNLDDQQTKNCHASYYYYYYYYYHHPSV